MVDDRDGDDVVSGVNSVGFGDDFFGTGKLSGSGEDVYNPLLDDDEDDVLPELDFDGVMSSGEVRAPELVDLVFERDNIFPDDDEEDGDDGEDDFGEVVGSVSGRGDDLASILGAVSGVVSPVSAVSPAYAVSAVSAGGVGSGVSVTRFYDDNGSDYDDDLDSILAASEDSFEGYDLDSDDYDVDELAGFRIDTVIERAIDAGASDIHLSADTEVAFTVRGDIVRVPEFGLIPPMIVQRVYTKITSNVSQSYFAENFELDTSYVVKTGRYAGRRLRLSVGRSFSNIFMVFRVISDVIPSPDDLGVSPVVQGWAELPSGLVLICGPTGTGKTTTFASLIRKIQLERAQKIITVEKPIEYIYGDVGKAFVTQREIGPDARSFDDALTSAVRQHPDVIMVGEVRDRLEFDTLLRASETGHLALSTMHTNSPSATITRIKSLYDGDEQLRVLGSLGSNLRGIANQVLLKSVDGRSQFAVQSVLNVDDEVSVLIGEGDAAGIEQYMRSRGLTMEHELIKAFRSGKCTLAEARSKSSNPIWFDKLLKDFR